MFGLSSTKQTLTKDVNNVGILIFFNVTCSRDIMKM